MRKFIKQALLATAILLLLLAVFWNTLTATAFWGLALHETKDHSATKITPEPIRTLTTASSTASSTVYKTITIPHLFAQTDVLQTDDKTRLVFSDKNSNAYYLISTMGSYQEGFMTGLADKSDVEIDAWCHTLTTTFAINPCQNDRAFLTAVMTVNNRTVGLFSSNQRKNATATFLLLKNIYVPAKTERVVPFKSNELSGHLAYDPIDSIAYFFTTTETGYEMVFVHMDQSEIESVLASISNNE